MKTWIIFILSLVFLSCKCLDPAIDAELSPIKSNTEQTVELGTDISDKTEGEIKSKADKIVLLGSDSIERIKRIELMEYDYQDTQKRIESLQQQLLEQEIKFRSELDNQGRKIWIMISAFSAIACVTGIALAVLYSPKIGITVFICGIAVTAVSQFVLNYAVYIAIGGGIILALCSIAVIIYAYKNKKALFETVKSMELVKHAPWTKDTKTVIDSIQSKDTKKIVHDLRQTIDRSGKGENIK
jgi:hypothetical protein